MTPLTIGCSEIRVGGVAGPSPRDSRASAPPSGGAGRVGVPVSLEGQFAVKALLQQRSQPRRAVCVELGRRRGNCVGAARGHVGGRARVPHGPVIRGTVLWTCTGPRRASQARAQLGGRRRGMTQEASKRALARPCVLSRTLLSRWKYSPHDPAPQPWPSWTHTCRCLLLWRTELLQSRSFTCVGRGPRHSLANNDLGGLRPPTFSGATSLVTTAPAATMLPCRQ